MTSEENNEYTIAPEGYFQLGSRLNPRTNQPYETTLTSKGFHIELRGSTVKDHDDIKYIQNIFSGRDIDANCVRFALSGPEGGRPVTDNHQHAVIQLKSPKRIRFQHILSLPSGKQVMVYAMPLTDYSQLTGDVEKLIQYIKKHNTVLLVDYKNEELQQEIQKEKKGKNRAEQVWEDAMQQYPLETALKTLSLLGPRQYNKELKDFGLAWQKKWAKQVWLDATYKPNLRPWDEDNIAIDEINEWVRKNSPNKSRGGNLFIIGPSKTGKSEYIIQEVCRKYNCYYIKGKFDWTNYDNVENYKFYVFDDVIYDKEALESVKALTSSINTTTNINVKYSMAFVKCRPCIHILNEQEYAKFKRMSRYNGGLEWWGKNSKEVYVENPLFKKKSKIQEEKMELENTMSENSIESFDDNNETQETQITPLEKTPLETINTDENEEEEEEENENEEGEKSPKKPYTRQNKHSFRARFKHMLRQLDFDEDTVQETMEKFDKRKLDLFKKKEAIEYGFGDVDDINDHESMQDERDAENLNEMMEEKMNRRFDDQEIKNYKDYTKVDDELYDYGYNDDDYDDRNNGDSNYYEDGIIYTRFG